MEQFCYQMYAEVGYYCLVGDYLSHLLVDLENPSYSYFAPHNVPMSFDSTTMLDVNEWLKNEGNNIIYIYGEPDPWTAGAVELGSQTNVLKTLQDKYGQSKV